MTTIVTTLDENGYPVYRRRRAKDFMIVPHNRNILLDWDAHINVEFAGESFTVLSTTYSKATKRLKRGYWK